MNPRELTKNYISLTPKEFADVEQLIDGRVGDQIPNDVRRSVNNIIMHRKDQMVYVDGRHMGIPDGENWPCLYWVDCVLVRTPAKSFYDHKAPASVEANRIEQAIKPYAVDMLLCFVLKFVCIVGLIIVGDRDDWLPYAFVFGYLGGAALSVYLLNKAAERYRNAR